MFYVSIYLSILQWSVAFVPIETNELSKTRIPVNRGLLIGLLRKNIYNLYVCTYPKIRNFVSATYNAYLHEVIGKSRKTLHTETRRVRMGYV